MVCCFGSRAAAEKRAKAEEELDELHAEQTTLKEEAAQLRRKIQEEDASRERFDGELKQEEAHLHRLHLWSEDSKAEMNELRSRVSTPSPTKKSVHSYVVVSEAQRRESRAERAAEEGSPTPAALSEAWREAEKLMSEIARLSNEVKAHQSKSNYKDVVPLEQAEAAAASLRVEIAEARQSLTEAEEEGKRLEDEHKKMQNEEEPLQEWVEHVERELRLARAENSELTKAVKEASDKRADLQRDELEAFPHGAASASQSYRLQEQEKENIARKAVLLEEISAHRMRRDHYLEQAASCRAVVARDFQIAGGHQPPKLSPLPDAPRLPQRPLIASSIQTPATRSDHDHTLSAMSHKQAQMGEARRADHDHSFLATGGHDQMQRRDATQPRAGLMKSPVVDSPRKQKEKEEDMQAVRFLHDHGSKESKRTISPSRPAPRTHAPVRPIAESIPLLPPYEEESEPPLLSSPTPLFNMLASNHESPLDRRLVSVSQELSNEYDSDDEDTGRPGCPGYWTAVPDL